MHESTQVDHVVDTRKFFVLWKVQPQSDRTLGIMGASHSQPFSKVFTLLFDPPEGVKSRTDRNAGRCAVFM